jgi:glycosyltransferase involved in cell wall biosynthesis
MVKRPRIALIGICKNEAHNIGPLLRSMSGCFDAAFFTDTGSTDNTVQILQSDEAWDSLGCPITVSHFEWCDDFAKARQFNLEQVPKEFDYAMWVDFDDCLGNPEAFKHFRDHSMHCAHLWLAPYNYAFDDAGKPVCTFLRERVVKINHDIKWQYFIHEGLIPGKDRVTKLQGIYTWSIDHRRTQADLVKDSGRNLKIFDKHRKPGEKFCVRMEYYYGKELFDAGQALRAIDVLGELVATRGHELEAHDRLMAIQYLSQSYAAAGRWNQSFHIAVQGLVLHPERAEYWLLAGDALTQQNKFNEAITFYEGARRGASESQGGFSFTSPQARNIYPLMQMAQIAEKTSNADALLMYAEEIKKYDKDRGDQIEARAKQMKEDMRPKDPAELLQAEDIVISCPPMGAVTDWDEDVLREKGLGGSETAAVEIARYLRLKTNRNVKIFMPRKDSKLGASGVEYLPVQKAGEYFSRFKPRAHIAWRHTSRLTPAPSYVWNHDLLTPGLDQVGNYEKALCLSGFHKEFTMDMTGVPADKIELVPNGINPELFKNRDQVKKNPNKVIFSSSPDRGLERCIEIIRRVRTEVPDVELHLFYGFENMRKMGLGADADRYEKLIKENDFVKYHGFVDHKTLTNHFLESAVWLYPADFIETFCITAWEAMCAHAWPVVRQMGALPWTMKDALESGQCDMLSLDASCSEEYDQWARVVIDALKEKKYERMAFDPEKYSWEKASDRFIEVMGLK